MTATSNPQCTRCHHEAPSNRVFVSLETNTVEIDGRRVTLNRRDAELLSILADGMPQFVPHQVIFQRFLGARASANPKGVVHARVNLLRARLKGTPLMIKTRFCKGYALRFKDATP